MGQKDVSVEMVCFDKDIEGINPDLANKVTLPSGAVMPVAAFGTFHSDWAQEYMKDATVEAIRLGWRHIDTARAYENEDVVGQAIREAIEKGYISSPDDLF
ncbi:MAG: aldo/keto reductase, partial [Planctomycetota bacterium]